MPPLLCVELKQPMAGNNHVPILLLTMTPPRASTSLTRVPLARPPMLGLQLSSPMLVDGDGVTSKVRAPRRLAAAAASHPACPPPTTTTSTPPAPPARVASCLSSLAAIRIY